LKVDLGCLCSCHSGLGKVEFAIEFEERKKGKKVRIVRSEEEKGAWGELKKESYGGI